MKQKPYSSRNGWILTILAAAFSWLGYEAESFFFNVFVNGWWWIMLASFAIAGVLSGWALIGAARQAGKTRAVSAWVLVIINVLICLVAGLALTLMILLMIGGLESMLSGSRPA